MPALAPIRHTHARRPGLYRVQDSMHLSAPGTAQGVFSAWAPGSLARHNVDAIEARIATYATGAEATSRQIYSAMDHAAGAYTRSATNLVSGYDLTGLAAQTWQGATPPGGTNYPVQAIGRQYVVAARHVGLPLPLNVRFVTSSGAVVDRTISTGQSADIVFPPIFSSFIDGFTIYRLDTVLPGTIAHFKVLPTTWFGEKVIRLAEMPFILTDGIQSTHLHTALNIQGEAPPSYLYHAQITSGRYAPYNKAVTTSSYPVFLMVSGALILIGNHYTTTYANTFTAAAQATMNAFMAATGESLTLADLSAFPTF